ncbi:BTAD domain-containing putative transcriptional regulator [Saccharothrix xinjiangensis]|uniref:BTAD domain-containing putative transcriptional regulator n=1 Tax=Saccharothrix xinjiangensis TaxID=204798 RepID=A0ABV9XY48_9PSEU
MRVVVLGPVRAFGEDGAPIVVGGIRLRMLLCRLALSAGEAVSAGALVNGLWGAEAPDGAANSLHALVYRLRKALGGAGAVEFSGRGYRLALSEEQVDAHRFERLVTRGRRELAADRPGEAAASFGEALALWRGAALADVLGAPFAGPAAARLEELRAGAREDRFDAELRLGHHADVLADLGAAATEHPLRERLAALRMRALHAAGRQAEALVVYRQVRDLLSDQLGVDPSAEVQDAHLAVLRGGPTRAEPPAGPAPGRLPARLTTFIGRERELALLAELMATSRLVTVVGPGGVGKTRLAIEAAAAHRAHRNGRLWLVPLAGVPADSEDGVVEAILGVLGAANGGRSAEPLQRVAEALGSDEAVLVLDNCEHLVGPAAEFARRLLEHRPRLTVLATSRESLEVVGEALCRLPALDLPRPGADLAEAAGSAAVRLFTDRAAAVRPGFRLDESTVDDVLSVVRRLDGLPLALELAAARLRTLSTGEIVRGLDDRFRLLSRGNRAAQPRQRTLRAVIEWSWDLLTDPERVVARRFSVFPSLAGSAAALAVCADDALPPGEVGHLLGSLVEKSIVERSGEGYRMLESVREYAAGELRRAGAPELVRDRFARHFAGVAAEHEPLLRSDRQAASLVLFEAEYDNLVFALHVAVDDGHVESATRLLGPLYWYWGTLRYDARSDTLVSRVLDFGDALPEDARAAFTAFRLPAGGSAERVRAVIEDCARTGALERYPILVLTTLPMAHQFGLEDLVEREIRAARDRADRWARAATFLVDVFIGYERGDWGRLRTGCVSALRGFEAVGDRLWTAMALAGVARIHSVEGAHESALAAYQRGAELTGPDEVPYRLGLAVERVRGGDPAGARRDVEAAERVVRSRGPRALETEVLIARSELCRRTGQPDRADRELDRVAGIAAEVAMPAEVVEDRIALARVANRLSAGDTARARDLLPGAVRAAFAHRDVAPVAEQLARLLHAEGDVVGAATALGLSQTIRGAFDRGEPELRELVAALARQLGRTEYDRAYRQGSETPRQDALDRLSELIPV